MAVFTPQKKQRRQQFRYGSRAPQTGRDVTLGESIAASAAQSALSAAGQIGVAAFTGSQGREAAEERFRQESVLGAQRESAARESQERQIELQGEQTRETQAQKFGLQTAGKQYDQMTAKGGKLRGAVVSEAQKGIEDAEAAVKLRQARGEDMLPALDDLIKKYETTDKREWRKLNTSGNWRRTNNTLAILREQLGSDHDRVKHLEGLVADKAIRARGKRKEGFFMVPGFGPLYIPPKGQFAELPDGTMISSEQLYAMTVQKHAGGKTGMAIMLNAEQSRDPTIAQNSAKMVQLLRGGLRAVTGQEATVKREVRQQVDAIKQGMAEGEATPGAIRQAITDKRNIVRQAAIDAGQTEEAFDETTKKLVDIAGAMAEGKRFIPRAVFNPEQEQAAVKRLDAESLAEYRTGKVDVARFSAESEKHIKAGKLGLAVKQFAHKSDLDDAILALSKDGVELDKKKVDLAWAEYETSTEFRQKRYELDKNEQEFTHHIKNKEFGLAVKKFDHKTDMDKFIAKLKRDGVRLDESKLELAWAQHERTAGQRDREIDISEGRLGLDRVRTQATVLSEKANAIMRLNKSFSKPKDKERFEKIATLTESLGQLEKSSNVDEDDLRPIAESFRQEIGLLLESGKSDMSPKADQALGEVRKISRDFDKLMRQAQPRQKIRKRPPVERRQDAIAQEKLIRNQMGALIQKGKDTDAADIFTAAQESGMFSKHPDVLRNEAMRHLVNRMKKEGTFDDE